MIIGLCKAGYSYRKIELETGIPKSTAKDINDLYN